MNSWRDLLLCTPPAISHAMRFRPSSIARDTFLINYCFNRNCVVSFDGMYFHKVNNVRLESVPDGFQSLLASNDTFLKRLLTRAAIMYDSIISAWKPHLILYLAELNPGFETCLATFSATVALLKSQPTRNNAVVELFKAWIKSTLVNGGVASDVKALLQGVSQATWNESNALVPILFDEIHKFDSGDAWKLVFVATRNASTIAHMYSCYESIRYKMLLEMETFLRNDASFDAVFTEFSTTLMNDKRNAAVYFDLLNRIHDNPSSLFYLNVLGIKTETAQVVDVEMEEGETEDASGDMYVSACSTIFPKIMYGSNPLMLKGILSPFVDISIAEEMLLKWAEISALIPRAVMLTALGSAISDISAFKSYMHHVLMMFASFFSWSLYPILDAFSELSQEKLSFQQEYITSLHLELKNADSAAMLDHFAYLITTDPITSDIKTAKPKKDLRAHRLCLFYAYLLTGCDPRIRSSHFAKLTTGFDWIVTFLASNCNNAVLAEAIFRLLFFTGKKYALGLLSKPHIYSIFTILAEDRELYAKFITDVLFSKPHEKSKKLSSTITLLRGIFLLLCNKKGDLSPVRIYMETLLASAAPKADSKHALGMVYLQDCLKKDFFGIQMHSKNPPMARILNIWIKSIHKLNADWALDIWLPQVSYEMSLLIIEQPTLSPLLCNRIGEIMDMYSSQNGYLQLALDKLFRMDVCVDVYEHLYKTKGNQQAFSQAISASPKDARFLAVMGQFKCWDPLQLFDLIDHYCLDSILRLVGNPKTEKVDRWITFLDGLFSRASSNQLISTEKLLTLHTPALCRAAAREPAATILLSQTIFKLCSPESKFPGGLLRCQLVAKASGSPELIAAILGAFPTPRNILMAQMHATSTRNADLHLKCLELSTSACCDIVHGLLDTGTRVLEKCKPELFSDTELYTHARDLVSRFEASPAFEVNAIKSHLCKVAASRQSLRHRISHLLANAYPKLDIGKRAILQGFQGELAQAILAIETSNG